MTTRRIHRIIEPGIEADIGTTNAKGGIAAGQLDAS
jgi:hypothetical protein